MTVVAPRLGELLNLRPGSMLPVTDSRITARCEVEDCMTRQLLGDAPVTQGPDETCYRCDVCGADLVVVSRAGRAPRASLRLGEELGQWSYWLAGSGVHVGLANRSRVRSPLAG
jgi:hypothetical protein